MTLKFICCDVFARVACGLVAASPHIVDIELVPMLAHTHPEQLRLDLQRRIDGNQTGRDYDAVILGYGLCGNTTAGLTCPVDLIIPRVHDCCALFLGSKERFNKEFGHAPSTRWCSNGYYERCYITAKNNMFKQDITAYKTNPEYLKLIEEYGEDNADYVWETLHPDIETDDSVYISLEGYEFSNSLGGYRKLMDEKGVTLRQVEGELSYLRDLVNGPWDAARFLTVKPGQKVTPVYDLEVVLTAGE